MARTVAILLCVACLFAASLIALDHVFAGGPAAAQSVAVEVNSDVAPEGGRQACPNGQCNREDCPDGHCKMRQHHEDQQAKIEVEVKAEKVAEEKLPLWIVGGVLVAAIAVGALIQLWARFNLQG